MDILSIVLICGMTSIKPILSVFPVENVNENDDSIRLLSDDSWIKISRNTSLSYELSHNTFESNTFKYKPPDLEIQFLHMNINGLSIGSKISPEFDNLVDLLGGILLHTAVDENNLNMIESLIDAGSDLNIRDNDGITPLYRALKLNNSESMKLLIEAGANTNAASSLGNTLVHMSVIKGDTDVLEKLIQLGAQIDTPNNDGLTPLYKAAETSNHQAIEKLIAGKANVNWLSDKGESLLHTAVYKGRLDVVKELIRNGADIDTVDNEGATPLYIALTLNNPGIIKILLDSGANSSFSSPKGESLLHKAVADDRTDIIQKLIHIGSNIYSLDTDSLTPLYLAIKLNKIDVIKTLIRNRVDINEKNQARNDFPLHFSVTNGTLECVELLLKKGAKTFVLNGEGMTPLVLAIFDNKPEIIDVLYRASPEVNYKTGKSGNTPLHLAVLKKDLLSAEKLLKKGAVVDALNGEGLTPLCKAAQANCGNIIRLLVKNGANVNFTSVFGDSPLHLAVANYSISAVIALVDLGSNINCIDGSGFTPLCKAIKMNSTNMINSLLAKNASVDIPCREELPTYLAISDSTLPILKRLLSVGKQNYDYSVLVERAVQSNKPIILKYFLNKYSGSHKFEKGKLLFLAASSGSADVIEELLNLGGSVNVETNSRFTPLWFATKNNKPSAMKVLIENGAELNKTFSYNRDGLELRGWTLLHEAALNDHEDALQVLLSSGVNINEKDERKWTPLHYAAAQNNVGAVRILVSNGANIFEKTRLGEVPIDLVKRRRSYEQVLLEWLSTGKVS